LDQDRRGCTGALYSDCGFTVLWITWTGNKPGELALPPPSANYSITVSPINLLSHILLPSPSSPPPHLFMETNYRNRLVELSPRRNNNSRSLLLRIHPARPLHSPHPLHHNVLLLLGTIPHRHPLPRLLQRPLRGHHHRLRPNECQCDLWTGGLSSTGGGGNGLAFLGVPGHGLRVICGDVSFCVFCSAYAVLVPPYPADRWLQTQHPLWRNFLSGGRG